MGALGLFEGAGYRIVRYGFMMVRDLAEPIADRRCPPGWRSGRVGAEQHRGIWDADEEAFRDHWSPAERNDGDYRALFAKPESTPRSGRSPGTATRSRARC